MAAKLILTLLPICRPPLNEFFEWILQLITKSNDAVVDVLVQYLGCVLGFAEYRLEFLGVKGIDAIMGVLGVKAVGAQVQYQCVYCLWMLSFVPQGAEEFAR